MCLPNECRPDVLHDALVRPSRASRRLADAVLPARLADLGTHLDFLEDADYLRFAESGFLHVETPLLGILYFRMVQAFKGASTGDGRNWLAKGRFIG